MLSAGMRAPGVYQVPARKDGMNGKSSIPAFASILLSAMGLFLLCLLSAPEVSGSEPGGIDVSLHENRERNTWVLRVSGILEFEKDYVWYVLTAPRCSRCAHTKDILDFSIRRTGPETGEAYYLVDFPWPMQDRWVVTELRYDKKNYRIGWRRLRGTIPYSSGFYELRESENYTRITYESELDPGLRHVPRWLINYVTRSQARKLVINIASCLDDLSLQASYRAVRGPAETGSNN
jgi:hypothetical protein